MSRFVSKTLRRLPSTTREIARISNDLASAETRLANRIWRLAEIERIADASAQVRCTNGAHTDLVAAALDFVQSFDPETSGRERIAAIGRLKDAVAYLDPDRLFEDESNGRPEPATEGSNRPRQAGGADCVADPLAGG